MIEVVKQRVELGQVWRHPHTGLWLVVTEPANSVDWDAPDENGTSCALTITRATFLSLERGVSLCLSVDGVWASDAWELALAAPV